MTRPDLVWPVKLGMLDRVDGDTWPGDLDRLGVSPCRQPHCRLRIVAGPQVLQHQQADASRCQFDLAIRVRACGHGVRSRTRVHGGCQGLST